MSLLCCPCCAISGVQPLECFPYAAPAVLPPSVIPLCHPCPVPCAIPLLPLGLPYKAQHQQTTGPGESCTQCHSPPCPMQPYAFMYNHYQLVATLQYCMFFQRHAIHDSMPSYFVHPSSHQYFCPAMHLAQLQLTYHGLMTYHRLITHIVPSSDDR